MAANEKLDTDPQNSIFLKQNKEEGPFRICHFKKLDLVNTGKFLSPIALSAALFELKPKNVDTTAFDEAFQRWTVD